MMNDKKGEIREKFREVLPYIRYAMKKASKETAGGGTVMFGILVRNPDGTGRIVADFRAGEFFDDLAEILDLPKENTAEEDLDAEAVEMLNKMGLGL